MSKSNKRCMSELEPFSLPVCAASTLMYQNGNIYLRTDDETEYEVLRTAKDDETISRLQPGVGVASASSASPSTSLTDADAAATSATDADSGVQSGGKPTARECNHYSISESRNKPYE